MIIIEGTQTKRTDFAVIDYCLLLTQVSVEPPETGDGVYNNNMRGKDSKDPSTYRPIALTSCVCKTMERMINDRLVWFLESSSLIMETQSGFRKTVSTMDHLVRFETFVREGFLKGEHVMSVFFDLEKAYDTTWKYGIMKDLHDMDLRGHLLLFIIIFFI